MPTRKDEAVSSRPIGITRVVSQVSGPNGVCDRGRPHRQAGVAGVCFLHTISRKKTKSINCLSLKILDCHNRLFYHPLNNFLSILFQAKRSALLFHHQ